MTCVLFLFQSEDDSGDELPDGGAEFGWFNDLYVLDTGVKLFMIKIYS